MIKILPFGVIWGGFGFLYVLVEYGIMGEGTAYPSTNNPYQFDSSMMVAPTTSFIMGILVGVMEVLFFNSFFVNKPFWQKIIFKTGVYLFLILVLLFSIAFLMNSVRLDMPVFHPKVFQTILLFAGNFSFWSIVLYISTVTMLSLFIAEVTDYLGGSVFNNFFTGKYHHPCEEERIFMFLDIRSSTTIAEQLGHVQYFQLLNRYYADLTDAIVQTDGEIYQYAGDEIIVSWSLKKGVTHSNCIRCFFIMKATISSLSENYIKSFGLVPAFKAGFHSGKVTTGEIGVLKKEIFFTGDVLNTTARIQARCNELGTDNLISEELVSQLDLNDRYHLTAMGECELRGRQKKINLFSIEEDM